MCRSLLSPRHFSSFWEEHIFQILKVFQKLNLSDATLKLEMESELRSLIGKYGMRAVHEGLMKEMQDTFSYLQSIFHAKNEIVHPVVPHVIPTVEVVNSTIPEQIVHQEPVQHEFESDSLSDDVPPMPADPTVKHISLGGEAKPKVTKSTVVVKHQKQQHREEVEKKRQELTAKGIKPESLLTEDNLRKWLGQGYSYQKIAKETGVHEVQVSNTCKTFGLQSSISRYVAMKKTS
jgi:hypothetical protein